MHAVIAGSKQERAQHVDDHMCHGRYVLGRLAPSAVEHWDARGALP
jgi:hypothetical protein